MTAVIGSKALWIALVGLVLGAILAIGPRPAVSSASSHREAPLISEDPAADNTDLYAFVSPDRPDTVTIVANWIPLEEPAGGPNFASFDDDVLYAINVDSDGDAKEDTRYEFRFTTRTRNPNTFLYNTGPITSLDDADWNRPQTYTVTRVRGHERRELGSAIPTPPVNIGPRSTPNYDALAAAAVRDLPGGTRVFAGQRDDPFYVDLGSVFDLAGLRPFNAFHLIPLAPSAGVDGVAGYNTHTIALQVPIAELGEGAAATIGVYASSSRRAVRILREDGTSDEHGKWVQVSRLGNPLINEVVIPLGQKDRWNAADPAEDAQFASAYTEPEVPGLVNLLYPALPDVPTTRRSDLVAVLLTGVPGLNFTGERKSDLLRLNVTIPPSSSPSRFGALEGDFAGFPNGRRLADDVTDIELRALACGYGSVLAGALGLCNLSPNNVLGDGVDANDKPFMSTFPYAATPHQGYES